ncbi:branched-chain amino acid aminotransferase II [Rhizodiscina lignyota]|uniref:Branched-chain-amino-acid aminotransferase n=1 Tax=Rhizodiscina lignyota TaxID=1504668 RepID=A0A9P4M8H5_9PEZI|nr:branched-chain amino acid aminotransferase II [Rhizodiscina lignyota]
MTVSIETTSNLTANGIIHTLEKTADVRISELDSPKSPEDTNGFTNGANGHTLTSIDASLTTITHSTSPRSVPAPDDPAVLQQKTMTDHMLTCQWTSTHGWQTPTIVPYGPLSIMPSSSVLHYATECFEGMKLYRGYDGKLRLFRPTLNAQRMLLSSTRIALPGFDPSELLKLVVKLCAVDGPKWLPKERPGQFLYVRPTMIGNDPALGVQQPKEALFFVILSMFPCMDVLSHPVTGDPRGIRLLASQEDMVRAWPGGFGYAKVGANYGPSLVAQAEARSRGFDQILWLFGPQCAITEAGASNVFVVWRTREGGLQLVTAPLHGKIILDGVTRRSVLELARERLPNGWEQGGLDPLEVVEREFTMGEVEEAINEGRLLEAFTCGTAFFVAPIECVSWRGKELSIPCETVDGVCSGKYTALIKGWLKGIMYGKERHEWGYVVDEADV